MDLIRWRLPVCFISTQARYLLVASPSRDALLAGYEGQCVVTGYAFLDVLDVLDAAHIHAYRGTHPNKVDNGLLLRPDTYTFVDSALILICADSMSLPVATEYGPRLGYRIRPPPHLDWKPNEGAKGSHAEIRLVSSLDNRRLSASQKLRLPSGSRITGTDSLADRHESAMLRR